MAITKLQKLINSVLDANGIAAGSLCISSVLLCAYATVALLAAVPFVPNRVEMKIQKTMVFAAGGVAISIGWGALTTIACNKWRKFDKSPELEEIERERLAVALGCQQLEARLQQYDHLQDDLRRISENAQRIHQEVQEFMEDWNPETRTELDLESLQPIVCGGCQNYHGQNYNGTMLICGFHPYGWDGDECSDWEAISRC